MVYLGCTWRPHSIPAGWMDWLSVGRPGPDLSDEPRDLERQLGLPYLRPAHVRDQRSEHESVAGRPAGLWRGLAQQSPRLPTLGLPRAALVAVRSLGLCHPLAGVDR